IYGHSADMDPIMKLAEKYNLKVLEDAAEVHGAEYKNKKCGSIGHISSFSFYANKIISSGEGGMVLCNDDKFAELAKSYRNLCFKPERRFWHTELGYNFRMTNLQAAVGLAQLEKIEEYIKIKREFGEYYRSKLCDISELKLQTEKNWAKTVYWMYAVELDSKLGVFSETVMKKLKTEGIDTRSFFIGLHEQPVLKGLGLFKNESYPVTENAAKYGFYLPSGLGLKKEQIDFVCNALKKIIFQIKRGEI
ncbi:DegT/DnrJ/EryC1/StrS family aminotransferase, partial [Candidatus Dependentiae bacterium]|nr:DegT/DnrJ/EryC1/StrS family aminotransferase [Candidatus Dependentiae bacterium]